MNNEFQFELLRKRLAEWPPINDEEKKLGLYFLFKNSDDELKTPFYIGSATGKNGLGHRINKQHLNEKYLNKGKNPVDGNEKSDTEKSTLRKSIAEHHKTKAGAPTIEYIKDNYKFFYLFIEESEFTFKIIQETLEPFEKEIKQSMLKGFILAIEHQLINTIKPPLNKIGKS